MGMNPVPPTRLLQVGRSLPASGFDFSPSASVSPVMELRAEFDVPYLARCKCSSSL